MSEVIANIDNPTKRVTVHRLHCSSVNKRPSKHKNIGSLGRDGGWITFNDLQAVQIFHKDGGLKHSLEYCGHCIPEK